MLRCLSISNVVLIEKLNLEFGRGLNILTGETGAGKSILMDALALALGARGDAGLVRHGTDMASVVAEFDSVPNELFGTLDENAIEYADGLILRRTLSADGKGRAWVNDVPVSVKLLKQIGDSLVEIHGQFANHTLLNPATHRETLDLFASINIDGFADLSHSVRMAYAQYHNAELQLRDLREMLERSANERDFLAHNVAELKKLNPRPGEEDELSTRRAQIMDAEKSAAILNDANESLNPNGVSLESMVFNAAHILERLRTDPNPYSEQIDKLYNIAQELATVSDELRPTAFDKDDIDAIEERLFAIRSLARKHRVAADELSNKLADMESQLNAIDNSDAELQKLTVLVKKYKSEFDELANKLSGARRTAADLMRTRILTELPDLKLGNADFMVDITDTNACAHGADDVVFMIKTNPGSPFAPLHRAASGGELARLMLVLRVVLAGSDSSHTFVFDEVDTGISGATASAVGLRLNKLAEKSQAIIITHSAQVAGFADKHFKIAKHSTDDKTTTTVSEITGNDRINEIARIISGAEITPESVATAKTLIKS